MNKAIIVALAALMGGCATEPVAVVAPVCKSMTTVWISKDDALTEKTAQQIEGNNLARARLCGGATPKPKSAPVPTS
jgi:hypothetical protein